MARGSRTGASAPDRGSWEGPGWHAPDISIARAQSAALWRSTRRGAVELAERCCIALARIERPIPPAPSLRAIRLRADRHGEAARESETLPQLAQIPFSPAQRGSQGFHDRGNVTGRPKASPCGAPGRSRGHASSKRSTLAASASGYCRRNRSSTISSASSASSSASSSRCARSVTPRKIPRLRPSANRTCASTVMLVVDPRGGGCAWHGDRQTPYCERWIGTVRRDCLDHVIVWNEAHLRQTLDEFLSYYHAARTHQALASRRHSRRLTRRRRTHAARSTAPCSAGSAG